MDARNDLADACPDAGLITEISDILASLADDDARFLGRDNGAEGQGCGAVFVEGARGSVFRVKVGDTVGERVDGVLVEVGGHGDGGLG